MFVWGHSPGRCIGCNNRSRAFIPPERKSRRFVTCENTHRQKGDTLYLLAQKYNVTLEKVIAANPQLADPNQLSIGEKIKIPTEPVTMETQPSTVYQHKVKQGDSLWKLSKAWNVPLKLIIDANSQLKNPNALLVGETVNIPHYKEENSDFTENKKIPQSKKR